MKICGEQIWSFWNHCKKWTNLAASPMFQQELISIRITLMCSSQSQHPLPDRHYLNLEVIYFIPCRGSVYEKEMSQKKTKWLYIIFFFLILAFAFFDKQVYEKQVNSNLSKFTPIFVVWDTTKVLFKKELGQCKVFFLKSSLILVNIMVFKNQGLPQLWLKI